MCAPARVRWSRDGLFGGGGEGEWWSEEHTLEAGFGLWIEPDQEGDGEGGGEGGEEGEAGDGEGEGDAHCESIFLFFTFFFFVSFSLCWSFIESNSVDRQAVLSSRGICNGDTFLESRKERATSEVEHATRYEDEHDMIPLHPPTPHTVIAQDQRTHYLKRGNATTVVST